MILHEPLAMKMRPRHLDEIVGQSHILNEDSLLYKMIKNDQLSSIILYGPPGTGKTTIAHVIANTTNANFEQLNAVSSGKKDIETVCKKAQQSLDKDQKRTILFIDEIHRFNKGQQDFLLPFVENGLVTLIGATTENPFFEVNPALMSRSVLFQLKPIEADDIKKLIIATLNDTERGLGNKHLTVHADAIDMIAEQANGDVRQALAILELTAINADNGEISVHTVEDVVQKPHLQYDKDGDMHYDTISAFIKSMRGSDPDATLYYLARMIEAGEDPKFIVRRIIIAASEDVSNADPMALVVATNASLAIERIGMPEGRIILAQAALYVAMAPKSDSSIKGIDSALEYIRQHPSNDIPPYLRDAHYKSAKKLGHGVDYDYPHAHPSHWCPQQYLPDSVTEYFYSNSHIGYEKEQADYQNRLRQTYNTDRKD
ncbi:replication-associated recombination protein A [bacterium]|nr:replication-associated recombination protein A [bacterium]